MRRILFTVCLFTSVLLNAQVSYNIDSVASWRDPGLELNGYSNTYNEVWGFTMKGREYGVIGSRGGSYIIDVTQARYPKLVRYIPGAYHDATNRDYFDYRGYLYMVCDQGPSTLQIVDLNYLPDSVSLIYDSDELFTNVHSIFIDTATAHLYACRVTKTDTSSSIVLDLEIFDISSSPVPQLLLTYDVDNIDAFHEIWVKNDTAMGNNMNSGLFFYDFSDLNHPVILNSIQNYEEKGYNHSGYPTEDGRYYYFTDETHGMDVKVVEIDNYVDPQVVGLFNAGVNKSELVAHNPMVRDTLLFVSYYHEGLQVYDIQKHSKPVKVGHYQTFTNTVETEPGKPVKKDYSGFKGAWGVYPYLPSGYILVSDREKGLFILSISDLDGLYHIELLPSKRLYPNPIGKSVDLVYPFDQIVRIALYDINGKQIEKNMKIENYKSYTRIYFSKSLLAGLYFLNVEAVNETFTEKIIKE